MKIEKKITLKAKNEKIDELKSLLESMVKPSQDEIGCIKYELYQLSDEPEVFFLIEVWEDAPSLEAHKKTGHFLHFKSVVGDLIVEKGSVPINMLG